MSTEIWRPITDLEKTQETRHIRFLDWLIRDWDNFKNNIRAKISSKSLRLYAQYDRDVTSENVKLLLDKAAQLQALSVRWTGKHPFINYTTQPQTTIHYSRENWQDLQYDIEMMAEVLDLKKEYDKI